MNKDRGDGGEILSVLADNLSDHDLKIWFPALGPKDVRSSLRQMARQQPAVPRQMALPAKNTETKNTSTLQLEEFVLYTDGASRGNPGQAAAGVSLVDSRGQEIVGEGLYLGQTTNNVAEYKALLFGLEKARSLGVVNLAIKLDSELIVRQLQGRYKVKNEKLIPLFVQTEKILADLKSYRISHVPRSENKRADQLANEALDNQQTNC